MYKQTPPCTRLNTQAVLDAAIADCRSSIVWSTSDKPYYHSGHKYVSVGEYFARRYICGKAAEPLVTLKVVRWEGTRGTVYYVSRSETFAGSFGRQTSHSALTVLREPPQDALVLRVKKAYARFPKP
jgi:hypothetical protein